MESEIAVQRDGPCEKKRVNIGLMFTIFYGILSVSSARAQSCSTFVGTYTADPAGCTHTNAAGTFNDGASYSSIVIAFNNASKRLGITYCRYADDCYSENYIADGNEHEGDVVNTGKRYTISCLKDVIFATRVGLFTQPLISTFVFSPTGFIVKDSFEHDVFSRMCSMVRTP